MRIVLLNPASRRVDLTGISEKWIHIASVHGQSCRDTDFHPCANFQIAYNPPRTRKLTTKCFDVRNCQLATTSVSTDRTRIETRGSHPASRRSIPIRAPVVHSSRSNIMGSTESARRAGIHVASKPQQRHCQNDTGQYQWIAGSGLIHDESQHPARQDSEE